MTALIAGGGLAGATLACLLADAGRAVTLVERRDGPADKVCGEFLSAEGAAILDRVGIDVRAMGAHRIARMRLIRGQRQIETALPFDGFSLTRRVLDEALLRLAADRGAVLRRGETVTGVDGATLHLAVGAPVRGEPLFLATGKHDVRGSRRPVRGAADPLVGFKTYLRLAPAQQEALAGHVDLVLLPDSYIGLQLVEDGSANLCLLVDRRRLDAVGGNWPALLDHLREASPHLGQRLAGAIDLLARPLTIARVPYGHVHPADDGSGIFRLGDQFGVIPSFCGGGMSIALHSALLAADCHLSGGDAAAFHRRLRADVAGPIARADSLYRMCRAPWGQVALIAAGRIAPGTLRAAARWTRIVARPAPTREAAA